MSDSPTSGRSRAAAAAPDAATPLAPGRLRDAAIPALARRFAAVFPHLDADAAAVALALYRLLARGAPVPWPVLAAMGGRSEAELRTLLAGWPGVYEEPAGIVGFGGLSIRAVSEHRLQVGGRTLYTRCAWDTLFLPALLGQEAAVQSRCAVSGAPVQLRVTPHAVGSHDPPGLQLSMLEPRGEMTDDLTRFF